MNWTNYRRLVDYLTHLDPAKFDYGNARAHADAGCVACAVYAISPAVAEPHIVEDFDRWIQSSAVASFLDCTPGEANYIYGGYGPTAEALGLPDVDGWIGSDGIRAALKRLANVAARYGGEPADTPAQSAYQPDESAFLASVRALIDAPLVGDEA